MKKKFLLPALMLSVLAACSDNSDSPAKAQQPSSSSGEEASFTAVKVDYSKGRKMNARLGKGINLGNSWDSKGSGANGDCGWGNCIKDESFELLKETGFNSVRIPVRWQIDSDYSTHKVDPDKLEGVKNDIQLAIDAGLAVVVNFHHYEELMDAGNAFIRAPENADSVRFYEEEKAHFLSMWEQVAKEFDKFPDSLLVLEILNEPLFTKEHVLNDITTAAYEVIRKNAPGKTIMIESYHAGKFADLSVLKLPEDGNIIFSGHYYEPYTYSHQGHGYACNGDASYESSASSDMASYVALAQRLYPDVNGGHVPMNMGEFGVAGSTSSCGSNAPSDNWRRNWTKNIIKAAERYDVSWHYWAFSKVGGFEAYDITNEKWYPGFPEAFFP